GLWSYTIARARITRSIIVKWLLRQRPEMYLLVRTANSSRAKVLRPSVIVRPEFRERLRGLSLLSRNMAPGKLNGMSLSSRHDVWPPMDMYSRIVSHDCFETILKASQSIRRARGSS